MDWLAQLLFFAAIAAVFWLLLIRPNVRRQKQQIAMQEALNIGDRIMLTSGIFGTIRGLSDDEIELEIAPGTTVSVVRGATGRVVPPAEPAALSDDAEAPARPDVEES